MGMGMKMEMGMKMKRLSAEMWVIVRKCHHCAIQQIPWVVSCRLKSFLYKKKPETGLTCCRYNFEKEME